MFKKTPERCKLQVRRMKWQMSRYMAEHEKRGVTFDYSQKGKERFYEVFDEIGAERTYIKNLPKNVSHDQLRNIGGFTVIYADPPWEYRFKCDAAPDKYYDTLPTKTLCEMKIPAAKDAVLFLWATNPLLPDGLQVMDAWQFEYKTNMVWIKGKQGMGYYVLGQHELLLIGVKGKIGAPQPPNRPPSIIQAPRTKHSEKPKIVYDLIEMMYPKHKYIELFARNHRKGWSSWGNQLEAKK